MRAVPGRRSGRAGLAVPLATKFHAPGIRKDWVERPGLVQRLADAAARTRIILVDAPAGFGKTTLVAQWRASAMQSQRFAWVSLDQGDNDPARLWWYITHALRRACPELSGEAFVPGRQVQVPDAVTVLPALVNELARLSAPVVLVLDDYHAITEASCHEQMTFFLQHLPSSARVVLITRTDPPLPLARLRTAGEMVEFRAPELRFSLAEAAQLVQAISAVQLSEPDLAVLVGQTEGWPAGLHLAALSLRCHSSPGAFVRQFSGDNKFITDFLVEEVLSRQPAEIRQFLVRTSILSRFCASLCDAVAGSANAAEIIDILDRENLFVVPLDETRQWFRYHSLFAHVLRGQLDRTGPGLVPALHERASGWHRRSGTVDEAIGHALAAGDLAGAVELIAGHWYAYVDSGRVATVRGWLRTLGDSAISADPVAAHCAAWTAALSGDRESVRRWLPVMEAAPSKERLPDGMRSLRFSVALLHGIYGFDGFRLMRESAVTAVELESNPTSPWYAMARTALGLCLYLSGEPEAAERPADEAVSSEAGIPLVRMLSLSVLSLAAVELGQLARAEELGQAARQLGRRMGVSEAPLSSLASMAAGAVFAARGQLAAARAELEHAIQFRQAVPGVSPWTTVKAMIMLAQVLLTAGDRAGAAALADQARLLLASAPEPAKALVDQVSWLQLQAAGQPQATPVADPLTEREVEVLHLLRGPLSLREIGEELHLSANTIKTHVQAIYRKLGVSTRQDAIDQGRAAGLL